MSGLIKAKKYDWRDTNMALFGSDTEKQVKKESAESEPAWQGAGTEVGLRIWRIEEFIVKDWPSDEYGTFYNGDSYIVLNTYKLEESDELKFDVHFWIGKNSTQDEYGTVAYKTVELDTFLDDRAVQHREVQGAESNLFKSYFPRGIVTMEGGVKSGFKHVEPESYTPRLMHFNGKGMHVSVREVSLSKNSLKPGDVYILDLGMKFIQFNGEGSSPFERNKASDFMSKLKEERGSSDDVVVDQGQGDSEFMNALSDAEVDEDSDDEEETDGDKKLLKLNVGESTFEEVKTGDITRDDLASDDVFLLDVPGHVFVWVGANASPDEKKNGLPRANKYMTERAKFKMPISVIKEGQFNADFNTAIAA